MTDINTSFTMCPCGEKPKCNCARLSGAAPAVLSTGGVVAFDSMHNVTFMGWEFSVDRRNDVRLSHLNEWDQRWITMAYTVSTWSKDPSTQVGAVIVDKQNHLISQGWNGFPRKFKDSKERLEDKETKYAYTVHAELNAVYNAGYLGVTLRGTTLYVYGLPMCCNCAKGVVQTGVDTVVMCLPEGEVQDKWKDEFEKTKVLLDEVGIRWCIVKGFSSSV